jgi:GntR family transcriptional regulator
MTEPIYRQIADDLRGKIESDVIAHGARLPTEIELMGQYDASRNTVRDAIRLLITRGLVETRPGQGTFVLEMVSPYVTTLSDPDTGEDDGLCRPELAAQRRTSDSTHPRVGIQRANGRIARELHLDPDSTVISRHQKRYIDGAPWSLQTSFYPMRLVEQGAAQLIQAADIRPGVVSYLREALGIEQAGWRDTIIVRASNEAEAGFFKLPDDGHVSMIEDWRTSFDQHGAPIRLTVSVYPADHNQLVANFGSVPGPGNTTGDPDAPGRLGQKSPRTPSVAPREATGLLG